MPSPLPSAVTKAIIKNRFLGMGRNENYRNVRRYRKRLSSSSINTTMAEFYDKVKIQGLEKTAEEYDVSQEVKNLEEIAVFSRDNSMELPSMLEGGRLSENLKKQGIDATELDAFVTNVFNRAKAKNFTFAEVIEQGEKLTSLEHDYGDFSDVRSEWETLGKAIPGRREELNSINREIVTANRNRKNILSKNATDEKTLEEYATNRQVLLELGLDIPDLSKLAHLLTNVKKEGFDPKAVISKFNA
ncbi:MAG: hypothetical protein OK457_10760, partial [Thaumarchaeota archaeon]|nr:hypothetical protein [Nitrososphaerota archaeon]